MYTKKNLRQYQDEFIELYKQGVSIRKIATKYGVNKNSVSRLIKEKIELRPKRSVTKEQIDMFYNDYLSGMTIYAIAKKHKLAHGVVYNALLKEYGVRPNEYSVYEHLVDDFKKDYTDGLSLRQIGLKYGISADTVNKYLMAETFERRDYSESGRLYEIDEYYFDELNKEKAYQLGIIFSIGNIATDSLRNYLSLSTRTKDTDLIFKAINGITDKDEKTLEHDGKGSYHVRIHCTHLADTLKMYGLGQKFINIPKEYYKEFLEGYLLYSINIRKNYLNIRLKTYDKKIITDYINNISFIERGNSLNIQNNKSIISIINEFPMVLEKIKEFISNNNELSNKWKSLLEGFY